MAIPRRNTVTKRVIFVPELVALADLNNNFTNNSKNASAQQQQSVYQRLMQYTAPEVYEITLDRLSSVRALRDAVSKRIPAHYLKASEGNIIFVESATPDLSAITRMLRDALPVNKLNEGAVIYAYCPPASIPHHVFVFQVVTLFVFFPS